MGARCIEGQIEFWHVTIYLACQSLFSAATAFACTRAIATSATPDDADTLLLQSDVIPYGDVISSEPTAAIFPFWQLKIVGSGQQRVGCRNASGPLRHAHSMCPVISPPYWNQNSQSHRDFSHRSKHANFTFLSRRKKR